MQRFDLAASRLWQSRGVRFLLAVLAVAMLAVIAETGPRAGVVVQQARSSGNELIAFRRAKRPSDALPHRWLRQQVTHVLDSRRVAMYTRPSGRRWTLYVVKGRRARVPGKVLCLFLVGRGSAGGTCASASTVFLARHVMVLQAGPGLLAGLAANDVARVSVLDRRVVRRWVRMTSDHGLIYDCRARAGCGRMIESVAAYRKNGTLLTP